MRLFGARLKDRRAPMNHSMTSDTHRLRVVVRPRRPVDMHPYPAGALYAVVFMPEVITGASEGLRKVFYALVIGSTLTFAVYVGFWFYYRAILFQAHKECRRFFLSVIGRLEFPRESREDSDGNAEMVLTEHSA